MIESNLQNANILVVDDQESNLLLLKELLELQGYSNIVTTSDPRETVSLYASFKPDLILLDLAMPYMNGFDVMRQLKLFVPDNKYLPILVLTADATAESKKRALSEGASDFLTKPFDLIEVALRIKNLLFTSYLLQQSEKQNEILEQKVEERTSELHKTNNELIIAKEKAETSDRLKSSFLRIISHEIRTPLNGILGSASLLAMMDLPPDEKQEFVDMMQDSGDRLVNTINDYVDMALIVSGNLEVNNELISVTKLIHEVANKFRKQCKAKNLTLNLLNSLNHNELTIHTDIVLLQKVLHHLMDNAVKFTHKGEISIGLSIKPSKVEFFVKDTGIGIAPEDKGQIFKIFVQGDASICRISEGSGLGLSIVNGILTLLGGEIHLDSAKESGTTIFFTIPNEINPHLHEPTTIRGYKKTAEGLSVMKNILSYHGKN